MTQQGPRGPTTTGSRGRLPGGPPDDEHEFRRDWRARLAEVTWFFRYVRPLGWIVAAILISSIAATLLRMPLTFAAERLTLHFDDKPYLWTYLGLATGATVLAGLCSLLEGYLSNLMGERIVSRIRQDVFARLEGLSMQAVISRGPGPLVQRLVRDVQQIRDLFAMTLTDIATQLLEGAIVAGIMLWLEPWLTLIIVGLFLLVAPIVRLLNRRVEKLARRIQLLGEEIIDQMVEAVGGFRDIQASGRFDRFARRFNDVVEETEQAGVRAGLWAHLAGTLPTLTAAVLIVVPYFIAVGRFESVDQVGRMITYAMLLGQLMPTFTSVVRATSIVARTSPALREVRETLESSEPAGPLLERLTDESLGGKSTGAATIAKAATNGAGAIRFENVGIVLGGRPILRDMSFEIPGGKFTAVVGQSGSGKTTLFHMLLRLLEPTSGRIVVDGQPLSELPLPELRRLVGFIPQNPFIFNLTLRDNLMIAAPDARSEAALNAAVEQAQLEELVSGRQQQGGLDAFAGHMGARLSGGERQRIALARLFLQDPQIIVCDEYTANIDVKTAKLIQESIDHHFRDRTRIVITHQLYSIRNADQIVVLDAGRVVQTGTHADLVHQPGLYRELCEVQALV